MGKKCRVVLGFWILPEKTGCGVSSVVTITGTDTSQSLSPHPAQTLGSSNKIDEFVLELARVTSRNSGVRELQHRITYSIALYLD